MPAISARILEPLTVFLHSSVSVEISYDGKVPKIRSQIRQT